MDTGLAQKTHGEDKIIVVSTHSVEEACHIKMCGADYLRAGTIEAMLGLGTGSGPVGAWLFNAEVSTGVKPPEKNQYHNYS